MKFVSYNTNSTAPGTPPLFLRDASFFSFTKKFFKKKVHRTKMITNLVPAAPKHIPTKSQPKMVMCQKHGIVIDRLMTLLEKVCIRKNYNLFFKCILLIIKRSSEHKNGFGLKVLIRLFFKPGSTQPWGVFLVPTQTKLTKCRPPLGSLGGWVP